jgi:hypothetical protein
MHASDFSISYSCRKLPSTKVLRAVALHLTFASLAGGFSFNGFVASSIHSNESTNQMQQFLRFITIRLTLILLMCRIWWAPNNSSRWQMGFNSAFKELNTAQHVSGILTSIIRSSTTAVAASGLPLERGGSSAVGRGRAGRPARPRPTALLTPRSNLSTPKSTFSSSHPVHHSNDQKLTPRKCDDTHKQGRLRVLWGLKLIQFLGTLFKQKKT